MWCEMPTPEVPAWLTDPEAGRSQRDAWEEDVRRVFDQVMVDPMGSVLLAAGAPSWWGPALKKLWDKLPSMPHWAKNFLDRSNPDSLEGVIVNLATASYNRYVLHQLADRGIRRKMWATKLDDNVRESHEKAHGQERAIDRPFVVGGYQMQYPGDQQLAPIGEWARCRCVVVGVSS